MVSGAGSGSTGLPERATSVPADDRALPRLLRKSRTLRLDQQFMLAGSLVSLLGMAVIGAWVTDKIVDSVTRNSAIAAAMYMESFIAPLSQELQSDNALSPATVARLHQVLASE